MCYAPETRQGEKKGDQWMDSYSNNLNGISHKAKDKYHKCETTVQIKMMHEERNKYAQETYYIRKRFTVYSVVACVRNDLVACLDLRESLRVKSQFLFLKYSGTAFAQCVVPERGHDASAHPLEGGTSKASLEIN